MSLRRVVVTGLGLVSPLANGVDASWKRLINGDSALGRITYFDVDCYPAKVAAQVPGKDSVNGFDVDKYISPKDQRKMDKFIHFGIAAAIQAVEDAGIDNLPEDILENVGVLIGSGIGGLQTIAETAVTIEQKGHRRVSPFFIPASLINLISGHVSMKYGFQGPNHAVVTACATSTHAIGDAGRLIQFGDADIMIAGGAEAAICPAGIAGFAAARALSTSFNDEPTKASRPWDKDRDGFVMGEGSGVIVLEEYEHAKKRGAKIYGELMGYGLSGDAYHLTAPHPEGRGAIRAMKSALKNAKVNVSDIGYINAHGTSTPVGDELEINAVKKVFADHAQNVKVSSTKSSIGHLLGAAGSVEAIFSILAMQNGILPPTLNLDNVADDCKDMNLIPHKAIECNVDAIMSNSFGFGGTNASLIFKKL